MWEKKIKLNLLVKKDYYSDGAWWVAQCVQYDIVCQSRTPHGLLDEFKRALGARLALASKRGQDDPFASLRPAPREVQLIFEKVRDLAIPIGYPSKIQIPGISKTVGLHAQLQP